jgi:beta-glucosidase
MYCGYFWILSLKGIIHLLWKKLFFILLGKIKTEDFELFARPIDFVGINHYSRNLVKRSLNPISQFKVDSPDPNRVPVTEMNWEVYPKEFYDALIFLKSEYNNPVIFITEKGAAYRDQVVNGK